MAGGKEAEAASGEHTGTRGLPRTEGALWLGLWLGWLRAEKRKVPRRSKGGQSTISGAGVSEVTKIKESCEEAGEGDSGGEAVRLRAGVLTLRLSLPS